MKTKLMKLRSVCLGIGLALSIGAYADVTPGAGINLTPTSAEHVVWQGTPISFAVPVGEERLISFPGDVEFKNLDPSLTSDKVSISNNDGTLYIRALQPFYPIRTYVAIKSTGQIVYLDLSAQNGGDDTAVNVVTTLSTSGSATSASNSASAGPTYISMLQYAVAEMYWPERLLTQLNQDPSNFDFARTPMYTTHAVHLIMGNNILALPEVSWRNGDLFVTAVLLMNPNKTAVNFDPFQDFIGNWEAKAFYPTTYLSPQGTANDRTMVFLVSSQPFNSALIAAPDYR